MRIEYSRESFDTLFYRSVWAGLQILSKWPWAVDFRTFTTGMTFVIPCILLT